MTSAAPITAYLVPEKFLPELLKELKDVQSTHGQLVIAKGLPQESVWAQQVWLNPEIIPIQSIGEAVKALRSRGALWAPYSFDNHRRVQLIQEQLPVVRSRDMDFLAELNAPPLGAYTLLDKNTLLLSAKTNSPFPLGEVQFKENKNIPPSRAYLKLWELFTLHGIRPKAGERVVDFGSCPGGWTWVLQQMGCHVVSIDKAPLDEKVARLPRVEFMKTDAFQLKPQDLGKIDWFFSDIICYPPKLFDLIQAWKESGLCKNFVCTIKFQGETDFETLHKFQALPNTKVIHLWHNKHEVTAIIQS
jgi:23S rRNA (cytidine2498-2'-O)-methyltransferase